ncbi:MAG: TonB-dependent receptor [Paludibacteraceae bacterium]|nr:TonB-dependent receptor [Paludibacteraceae bacterium]
MRKRIFLLLTMVVTTLGMLAQTLTISGVVTAQDEPDPVIGANVMVKGTTVGTITDFDGNFELQAKTGDVLVVSFMGYKSQEVKVAGSAPLRIVLVPDNVQLQEVVAIGYGTMKKSDLTGAVTSVSADQLLKAPVAGLDQALQGRAAGVTVTSSSGQPGEAATIRIRGIGSALSGNDPLYVVDGVITGDIKWLSPTDIKSMEILKDASAAAIYGSRGANGVIIITTKSGGEGKVNINFDAYWGFQNRWKKMDVLKSKDFVETELRICAMRDGAQEIAYYMQNGFRPWLNMFRLGNADIMKIQEFYPINFDYSQQETDWQDEVFNANAFMHNYNLSFDGGGERGHYALSASYFGQEGTIIGSNYNRFTLRLNTDFKIREWLKIGEHFSIMTSHGRNAMNNSSSAGASIISGALAMAPWDPVYYPVGSVNKYGENIGGHYSAGSNFKNVTNPYQMAYNYEPNKRNERAIGDIYLELTPIKGLTIKSALSADFGLERERNFGYPNTYTSYNYSELNSISARMERRLTLLEETTVTYAREIGKHNFSVMAGQTWSEYNRYEMGGSGAEILNAVESNWYLSRSTLKRTESSDDVSRTRRLSFLGRAFYNYDSRYMVTVNFRADASSKFTKNPWGFFPSAAVAWRLSEEPFMRDQDLQWLDNIKIRAGFGQVGNDGVDANAFQLAMFSTNNVFVSYPLGVEQVENPGAALLTLVDQNGKWETNQQWDAGIDFSFWNGKLSGAIDYFCRDTKDALLYVNAPAHVGNRGAPVKNVGNIRNEGFELTLSHENKVGDFHYNITGNISYLHNELTKVNGGSPLWSYGTLCKTYEGMALNSFWGYIYEGIYATDQEALDQLYTYTPSTIGVHAGDARYKDVNGDGKIDEDDKMVIGNPFPKLTYGLNFSCDFYGVDIQLFLQGVAGNSLYNYQRQYLEGSGSSYALASYMKDEVWVGFTQDDGSLTPVGNALVNAGVNPYELENKKGTIPNPLGSPTNTENSTRFLESGSYLRLKNLQIGYTFPLKWTQKFRCSRLRLYATASNLFTITKYKGYDPEVSNGVDYGNYPQSRTFTFGLNANF